MITTGAEVNPYNAADKDALRKKIVNSLSEYGAQKMP